MFLLVSFLVGWLVCLFFFVIKLTLHQPRSFLAFLILSPIPLCGAQLPTRVKPRQPWMSTSCSDPQQEPAGLWGYGLASTHSRGTRQEGEPQYPPPDILPAPQPAPGAWAAHGHVSDLPAGYGPPHGALPTEWGAISMGCQEEHFGTVGLSAGCLREGPKAGNGRDRGLGANKCEQTEG